MVAHYNPTLLTSRSAEEVIKVSPTDAPAIRVVLSLRLPATWSPFGKLLLVSVIRAAVREAFGCAMVSPRLPHTPPTLDMQLLPGLDQEFSIDITTPDSLRRPDLASTKFLLTLSLLCAYAGSAIWSQDLPQFSLPQVSIDGVGHDIPVSLQKEC